jgi:hypothetical protein
MPKYKYSHRLVLDEDRAALVYEHIHPGCALPPVAWILNDGRVLADEHDGYCVYRTEADFWSLFAGEPQRCYEREGADGFLGHMLAMRVKSGGLSELEWRLADGMLGKYHRQIGERPAVA